MSAISASGLNLTGYLQNTSVGTDSTEAQAATQSSAPDATTDTQEAKGHHHHHHGGGGSGTFGKIEQAVTSALQSAQRNSSADPNSIIKDAITQVLQGNSQGTSSSTGDTSADAETNAAATDPTAAGGQNFSTMLQSLGVNPQQFHADFMSAVQAAHGGQVDPSTALQSFPPGSTIDTTA
jgi:hypothetical protein